MAGQGGAGNPRLGIIASQFPEVHETFIVREIAALREAGVPLAIYSLKRCRDAFVHAQARPLLADTCYLAWDDPRVFGPAIAEALRHPVQAIAALGWMVRHHRWPPAELAKAFIVWGQSLALARRMRRDGITHVHAHWATLPTSAAVVVSRWIGVPFSFTAHAWDLFVHNRSLRAKVRLARRVITCTEYNARVLGRLCPEAPGKIVVNYHGVDLAAFQPRGGCAGTSEPLILSVGRLVPTKGFDTLVDACGMLRDVGVPFRAVIVGHGPLKRPLQQRIDALNLGGRVRLRQAMPQEELRRLYAEAGAFVVPSVVASDGDRDGIPNVLLEAMAMGLPVVATSVSGIPEAIADGRTGLLVPPRDPERLAQAMQTLISDQELAARLGRQAREAAEQVFDGASHMRRLTGHMAGLLGVPVESQTESALEPPRRRQRVLFVIWSLGLGGAEQVVLRLAAKLDGKRFEPMICCLNEPGPFAQQAQSQGIDVMAMHKRGPLDLGIVGRLARLMREREIDVVHTHLWGANLWGRLAARKAGVPVVVVTEHNVDQWKGWLHHAIDRWLAPKATHLVAVSEQVKAYYERHGIGVGRWQVIHNGIEPPAAVAPKRAGFYSEQGIAPRAPVIGWIGRLVASKRPADFLAAVRLVADRIPFVKAVMLGDGPLRRAVEADVRRLKLEDHVVLAGLRHDVAELLPGMSLLAFSSEREGLSMAMLEAMASGVPVVATNVGGNPELIQDGRTGRLVPVRAPEALAQAIMALLTEPEQLAAMGRHAAERVQRDFSFQQMLRSYERLYEGARPHVRVVHVIDHLGEGGAQRQLVELAVRLHGARWDVIVIALNDRVTPLVEQLRARGITVECLRQQGVLDLVCLWKLARRLRQWRPAIVQTWLFTADTYGRLAAWWAGVPLTVSAVRNMLRDVPPHHRTVNRWLARRTSCLTVNAEMLKTPLLGELGVSPSRVRTIYNGIELNGFGAPADNRHASRRVGMVARLSSQKDHRTFLEAARQVLNALPDTGFELIGEGPMRPRIEQWIRELDLKHAVRLRGHRDDARERLQAFDVVVLATHYEGCSNAIMEAMAARRPVVATDVGGNRELIVDGVTGYLVPSRDAATLAERMLELLNDPGKRAAMGSAARARVHERFTIEQTVRATAQLYDELLERRLDTPAGG